MTLIVCPECGREISSRAIACPQCGFPPGVAEPLPAAGPAPNSESPPGPWDVLLARTIPAAGHLLLVALATTVCLGVFNYEPLCWALGLQPSLRPPTADDLVGMFLVNLLILTIAALLAGLSLGLWRGRTWARWGWLALLPLYGFPLLELLWGGLVVMEFGFFASGFALFCGGLLLLSYLSASAYGLLFRAGRAAEFLR